MQCKSISVVPPRQAAPPNTRKSLKLGLALCSLRPCTHQHRISIKYKREVGRRVSVAQYNPVFEASPTSTTYRERRRWRRWCNFAPVGGHMVPLGEISTRDASYRHYDHGKRGP